MSEPHDEGHEEEQIGDLEEQEVSEQQADAVQGGAARRGGDDDLDDLEVER